MSIIEYNHLQAIPEESEASSRTRSTEATDSEVDSQDDSEESQSELQACLRLLDSLYDEPVYWDSIRRVKKSDLHLSVVSKLCNHINCDIHVRIATHLFRCHLLVLQTYAKYFISAQCGVTIYLPPDKVSPETFGDIYKWVLQQDDDPEEPVLTRRNALDMLDAATYLGMPQLEEECWAFIDSLEVFNEETAILLLSDAMSRGNREVEQLMLPRISESFLPMVESNDFPRLSLEVVCALLKSSYISVHDEMEVFQAAMRWLSYDWQVRHQEAVTLMKCIRFGFMKPFQLIKLMRNKQFPQVQYVTHIPEVLEMVRLAAEYAVVRCTFWRNPVRYRQEMASLHLKEPEARNWIGEQDEYKMLHKWKEFKSCEVVTEHQSPERSTNDDCDCEEESCLFEISESKTVDKIPLPGRFPRTQKTRTFKTVSANGKTRYMIDLPVPTRSRSLLCNRFPHRTQTFMNLSAKTRTATVIRLSSSPKTRSFGSFRSCQKLRNVLGLPSAPRSRSVLGLPSSPRHRTLFTQHITSKNISFTNISSEHATTKNISLTNVFSQDDKDSS